MTRDEFVKELDKLILTGINSIGPGNVISALAVVTRFTEVVYDMNTVDMLTKRNEDVKENKVNED